ncbi:patatin-like phospholipase family protein [Altererythrobacter sp. MF3-039]|uniref:patatin-like phospholipase family protein n=1 Tax=Altererythrobacter sp. MF3-039 TaxID=3252901 RepID=UPI00390CB74D
MADGFEQLVFSGGGIRCFWHGGFMAEVGQQLDLVPSRVSGVSGGALSAAAWIGGCEDDLRVLMKDAFAMNSSNVEREASNFTPHQELYRAVVESTLDNVSLERIAEGPQYEISLAIPLSGLPAWVSTVIFGFLYKLDEHVRSTPHLVLTRRLGLKAIRVDARQAARENQLIDLICAAATIPPIFDVPRWDGKRVIDGGMFDKAPIPSTDSGRTLVLMTSRYRNLPRAIDDREYVQPRSEVAASKIDFRNPEDVDDTWKQGARDGEAWLVQRQKSS